MSREQLDRNKSQREQTSEDRGDSIIIIEVEENR